jgi:hypothetical protein
VDHLKTGRIRPDFECPDMGCPVLVKTDHPKSRFVRFSDPHCIWFELKSTIRKLEMSDFYAYCTINIWISEKSGFQMAQLSRHIMKTEKKFDFQKVQLEDSKK